MMTAKAPRSILGAAILSCCAGAAAAVELTPAPPAVKPAIPVWVGYAISPTGRVFSERSAEEDRARVFARDECERVTGANCRAIAVPKSWKVSAIQCGAFGYIAGVPFGPALPLARLKAARAGLRGPCRQVFSR